MKKKRNSDKNLKLLDKWIKNQSDNDFRDLIIRYRSAYKKITKIPLKLKKLNIDQIISLILNYNSYSKINKKNIFKLKNKSISNELTHFKLIHRSHTSILSTKEKKRIELELKEIEQMQKDEKKKFWKYVKLDLISALVLKKKTYYSKYLYLKHSNLNVLNILKNKKYLIKKLNWKSFKKWHIIFNDILLKRLILTFMLNGNKYKSYKKIYKILNKIKRLIGINPLSLIHSFFKKLKSTIEVGMVRYKKKLIYKPKFVNYKKQIANVFKKIKELLFDSKYNKLLNMKITYEEKFLYILILFSLKKNFSLLNDSETSITRLFFTKKHLLNRFSKKKLKNIKDKDKDYDNENDNDNENEFKKYKKLKKNKKLNTIKKKIKQLTLKQNKYLEKEKNNYNKYNKYLTRYNNIKYINYNQDLQYHDKKIIQSGLFKEKKNDDFDYSKKKFELEIKLNKLNNWNKINNNDQILKKNDPFNIYITRSYNFNDYKSNIVIKNKLSKRKKSKFTNKELLKRKKNTKKKYITPLQRIHHTKNNKTNKLKKNNKFNKYNFANKDTMNNNNKKKLKNKQYDKKKLKNKKYNKKKKKKKKIYSWIVNNKLKKKNIWYLYNNISLYNSNILKNQFTIEKVILNNDYFSELKSSTMKLNNEKIKNYGMNQFSEFKKKY